MYRKVINSGDDNLVVDDRCILLVQLMPEHDKLMLKCNEHPVLKDDQAQER